MHFWMSKKRRQLYLGHQWHSQMGIHFCLLRSRVIHNGFLIDVTINAHRSFVMGSLWIPLGKVVFCPESRSQTAYCLLILLTESTYAYSFNLHFTTDSKWRVPTYTRENILWELSLNRQKRKRRPKHLSAWYFFNLIPMNASTQIWQSGAILCVANYGAIATNLTRCVVFKKTSTEYMHIWTNDLCIACLRHRCRYHYFIIEVCTNRKIQFLLCGCIRPWWEPNRILIRQVACTRVCSLMRHSNSLQ